MFCPKLCRSACPVSNAEPRETLTPWGKMSMAYFTANESVPVEASYAEPAWACTGCFGCREHCDHRNDVTGTLYGARSALMAEGVAPEAAKKVVERFEKKASVLGETARALATLPEVHGDAKTAVLLGCAYAREGASKLMRDAVRATSKLVGDSVSLAATCCGAPLLYAGDEAGFARQQRRLAESLAGKERLIVLDAGCASALRMHPTLKNSSDVDVEHFVELAGRKLSMLRTIDDAKDERWRYHDPCQLGRGLGVYEAPRAILHRALGRPALEFARNRTDARCSGAGGILPLTMPETSAKIADTRIAEHEELGGGTIVTACASSRRRFESLENRGQKTIDILAVVARAMGIDESTTSR